MDFSPQTTHTWKPKRREQDEQSRGAASFSIASADDNYAFFLGEVLDGSRGNDWLFALIAGKSLFGANSGVAGESRSFGNVE